MSDDLNQFTYTDNFHDVLAAYINELVASNMRGKLTNTETLTATKTLSDASLPIQNLTPSGADRDVLLPVEALTNHQFVIRNASGTHNLVVKDDSGGTTFGTLTPGMATSVIPLGGIGWTVIGADYAPASKGVTNGDGHNHVDGDGAQIDHGSQAGLNDDDHSQYLLATGLRDWSQQDVTPSNPDSGKSKLYFKSDKRLYRLSADGDDVVAGRVTVTPVVFTASGSWTKPARLIYAVVECVGGGGAGGGAAATDGSTYSSGGGGCGGGYALKKIAAGSLGSSETVTIGAGGAGVSGSAGNNGGTTSFGSHVSATGGSGGATLGAFAAFAVGGASGSGGGGSGGDINAFGGPGAVGVRNASNTGIGGNGGNSHLGGGGTCEIVGGSGGVNGNAGKNYGGGGAGSANLVSQSARAGGNGAPGIVIVWEYTEA